MNARGLGRRNVEEHVEGGGIGYLDESLGRIDGRAHHGAHARDHARERCAERGELLRPPRRDGGRLRGGEVGGGLVGVLLG